jgi:hypothetical protein
MDSAQLALIHKINIIKVLRYEWPSGHYRFQGQATLGRPVRRLQPSLGGAAADYTFNAFM